MTIKKYIKKIINSLDYRVVRDMTLVVEHKYEGFVYKTKYNYKEWRKGVEQINRDRKKMGLPKLKEAK